jgi:hypothetical protein
MGTTIATSDEPTAEEKRKIFDAMVIKARLSRIAAGVDSIGAQPMTTAGRPAGTAAGVRIEDSHKIVSLAQGYIDEQWQTRGIEVRPVDALAHIRATVDPMLYTSEPKPDATDDDENAAALRQVDHAGVRRAQRYVDEMHSKGINVSAIEALEHVGVITGG